MKIVFCSNYNKGVFDYLKRLYEPIYCRFRHRWFWDSGLHCLTLDTVREGGNAELF